MLECNYHLEVNDGADSDLDIILRTGIELRADVIGLRANRDARIIGPVGTAS